MENLISLSVIFILLSAMGSIIYYAIKTSKDIKEDLELSRELSIVMERITEDANLADRVKLTHLVSGDTVYIEYRNKQSELQNYTLKKISYGLIDAPTPGLSRIVVDGETAPLTGDSKLGKVHIMKFETKQISNHLFTVELTGISKITNHTYTLKTAIYTQGKVVK